MNLIIIAAFVAACGAAKLDRSYLPPPSAKSAGGSPGSLQTPFAGNSFNQGLGGLPKGSYTNDFQGVVVDAAAAGTRASGPGETGLGQPRISYGSTVSKVGEAAFQDTPAAGFRQVPGGFSDGQTAGSHVSSQFNQGSERPQAAHDRASNTVRFDSDVGPDSFNYAFETDNGIVAEENGVENNGVQAQGGYSYTGDDGQVYSVSYTADEGGYQPKGDHLPTPPPIPEDILRSLEQNAKEEAAGIVDDGSYDAQKYNTGGDNTENDSSGQYNAKLEQSGNRQPDASASGSFISQSNLRRPGANGLPTLSGTGITQGKSANAIASVSGSGPNKPGSRNDYLPPGQQGNTQGVSGQDGTGSSKFNQPQNAFGNFQPLSPIKRPQGPSGASSSAFASTQPDFRSQFNTFQQHQQSTNGKPNQFTPNTSTYSGQGQEQIQGTVSSSEAPGSSQFSLNAKTDDSHSPSQSSSSSTAFHLQSPSGRPQFGINSNNLRSQGAQGPTQSFTSFNSPITPSDSHSQFGINGDNTQNNNAQVPTQAPSFASSNSQSGSPSFGPSQTPTQSSSFASFNSQSNRGPSQSQFGSNTGQQGTHGGSIPTISSTSAFASFGSQSSGKPQSQFGTPSNNIQQDNQASSLTSFGSFNPQASTPSNGQFGGKLNIGGTQNTFSSANTLAPTQPSFGSGSPSPNGDQSRPQFGAQSQSSVHQGPGQTSSSSFESFNSQPSTGSFKQPSSQKSQGFGNQQSQFAQNGPVDTHFSSSTQRPEFDPKQGQDDSYYYRQPAKPFSTSSSQASGFPSASSGQTQPSYSAQSSTQSSNAPSRFPSISFSSQAQGLGHSRQPTVPSVGPTSPTQAQFNGITQATVSSFPASSGSPTSATNFNSQKTGQFGSRPTSSHFNNRPQSPQPGKHLSTSQAFAQKPNQFSQTNSFQSQSIQQPSGKENQPDSPENQSTISQQYNGEIYEYNKPAQSLPVPSHSDSTSGQFDQKEQATQSRPQSLTRPQITSQFDTQSSGSHLIPQGQSAGSAFGQQQFGQKGQPIQMQFNVESPAQGPHSSPPQFTSQSGRPQTPCCQGSTASAQSSFGPNSAQSVATSQFTNAGRSSHGFGQFQGHFGGQNSGATTQGSPPDQPSRQSPGFGQLQGHFSGQNLGETAQGSQPDQPSTQSQGSGQFQGQFGVQSSEATAQTFRPGQTSSIAGKGEVFGGPRKPPSFDAQTGYHY